MWTTENRPRYNRDKLRYPSDLTDAEWEHVKPLTPPAKRGGGKRRVNMREVVNGVMYVLSTGCQTTIFACGITTARWRTSITRSTSNAVSRLDARPVPPPASSTAKA